MTLLWGVVACVPSGQRESDPRPLPPAAPGETPGSDSVAPPSEDVEAAGEVAEPEAPSVARADSEMPKRLRIVSEQARSGLVAFANEMAGDGLLWVGPLAGNGGRDVLVYVPPEADNHADFRLVYHFHGTHSENVEKQRPGLPKKKWVGWNRLEQTLAAASDLQRQRDDNVALIYPLSAGKRREPGAKGWWNGAYDRMWMDPADPPTYSDSFELLHTEVTAILREQLGVHASKLEQPVIAEGHSAGGIALRNIATTGTHRVGEFLFQDASFQTWADGCYDAVKSGKSGGRLTLVITTKGIADPIAGRDPWCTRLESEAVAWAEQGEWCANRMERSPPGAQASCADLEAGAEVWPEFASWCEGMKNDMRDVAEVLVHRTRIPHGKQPRHFTGGLELPEEWHQGRLPSTR